RCQQRSGDSSLTNAHAGHQGLPPAAGQLPGGFVVGAGARRYLQDGTDQGALLRRLTRLLHDVGDDAGDVVRPTRTVGQVDEPAGQLGQLTRARQRLVDPGERDIVGQAVGAEQPTVTEPRLVGGDVDLDVAATVHRAQDHRALRVHGRLVP